MLRTEVIEYILTQINAIIKIQKIVRGFLIHRKYFEYMKNSKILGPMVKKIFFVWHLSLLQTKDQRPKTKNITLLTLHRRLKKYTEKLVSRAFFMVE